MSDLPDAIEAAAYDAADRTIDAIEQRKDLVFNGMFDPEVNEIAQAVRHAVEAIIRADERAKVAEEIAKAIEADSANDASETPDWYAGMNHAAGIARQHAHAPAETAAAGREGTPASDSVQGDPKPAETLSGHSGAQEAQG